MAIALDTVSSSASSVNGVLTYTHTVGVGLSNSLLIVHVSSLDSNHANIPISTVTYNGVGLTKIRQDTSATNNVSSAIYYLLNPASGANSVVITATGLVKVIGLSSSWSGVAQSGQPDAQNGTGTADNKSSAPSQAITTVANNSLIVDAISSEAAGTAIEGTETTLGTVQGQSFENLSAAYKIFATAGVTSMSATLASSQAWAYSAASFSPAATAPPIMTFSGFAFTGNLNISGAI